MTFTGDIPVHFFPRVTMFRHNLLMAAFAETSSKVFLHIPSIWQQQFESFITKVEICQEMHCKRPQTSTIPCSYFCLIFVFVLHIAGAILDLMVGMLKGAKFHHNIADCKWIIFKAFLSLKYSPLHAKFDREYLTCNNNYIVLYYIVLYYKSIVGPGSAPWDALRILGCIGWCPANNRNRTRWNSWSLSRWNRLCVRWRMFDSRRGCSERVLACTVYVWSKLAFWRHGCRWWVTTTAVDVDWCISLSLWHSMALC